MHADEGLDLSGVMAFNVTEYFGIKPDQLPPGGGRILERDDALPKQREPPLLQRLIDARDPLHLAVAPGQLDVIRVIDMKAVAPEVLGRITGDIGVAQQVGHPSAGGGDRHHTDTAPHRETLARPDEAEGVDGSQ